VCHFADLVLIEAVEFDEVVVLEAVEFEVPVHFSASD